MEAANAVIQGRGKHGDPIVTRQRAQRGDIRMVTTLVPKYEEDSLIFIGGCVGEGSKKIGGIEGEGSRMVYAQVDGGSDLSCILREHVEALGMTSQMVPREASRQLRVCGIGQQAESG